MPLIMLWPLLALCFEVAFLGYGLLIIFWIWDDDVWVLIFDKFGNAGMPAVTFDDQIILTVFSLLSALWALNFCRAISWTAMASAVGGWVPDDEDAAGVSRAG